MVLDLYKQQLSLPPPIRAQSQHTHQSTNPSRKSRDLGASHLGKATMEVKTFLLSLLATPLHAVGTQGHSQYNRSTLFSSFLFFLPKESGEKLHLTFLPNRRQTMWFGKLLYPTTRFYVSSFPLIQPAFLGQ